jgi:hypothetical protein
MAHMQRLVVVACLLATPMIAGCGKEERPVSVPMDAAVPPDPRDKIRFETTISTSTAQDTANPGGGLSPGGPASGAGKAAGRSIQSCCDALESAAKAAPNEGQKKQHQQAVRVCYQKANEILQGKVTPSQALAQTRASLIGQAPSACY